MVLLLKPAAMSTASVITKGPRLRRPAFDRERGVEIAQALFHARGYDAVGIAELTHALDIVPPSLYAAYGSKLALFERTLQRYAEQNALPLEQLLASDAHPVDVLTNVLVEAARQYTQDVARRGCMVTEAMRADDPQAAAAAAALAEPGIAAIRTYVRKFLSPSKAERVADYMLLTLRGISSYACLGTSQAKLVNCAKVAAHALDAEFPAR